MRPDDDTPGRARAASITGATGGMGPAIATRLPEDCFDIGRAYSGDSDGAERLINDIAAARSSTAQTGIDSSSTIRPRLGARRAGRVALLAAASRALHERDGVREPGEVGWLRCHVAQALDLPAAAVEAEFADDQSLLTATIAWLIRSHLRRQRTLADLLATGDFTRWAHAALVQSRTPGSAFGCEIGWLARQPDIADIDRDLLDNAYCAWQRQLATALRSLQSLGLVSLDIDVERLATTVLSLLQGAYMTACRTRDLTAVEATFDAAARLIADPAALVDQSSLVADADQRIAAYTAPARNEGRCSLEGGRARRRRR